MDLYLPGFEKRDDLRSTFIRGLILEQVEGSTGSVENIHAKAAIIPKKLIRYWHDHSELPEDVRVCLNSWDRLHDEGFEFYMFDDSTAAAYIADRYGERERQAFARCSHPAMRCDYLRMCFVLAEGGLYVDADEVLRGEGWRHIYRDGRLKVQPLCYNISAGRMVPSADIWLTDLPSSGFVFYINNNPLAAPANHPVLQRALIRATDKLLAEDDFLGIQSMTGPGNFTEALAAHAFRLQLAGNPRDFELLRDWDAIAETRWDLSYRGDARNWRNVFGC